MSSPSDTIEVRSVVRALKRGWREVVAFTLLGTLAADNAPDVATAAIVQLVAHRGRERTTVDLLRKLAAAPAGGAERVRIALAWLLGA